MSMYWHTQTREQKRLEQDEFERFIVVHSEHVLLVIVELVMQVLFIGALMACIMFLAAAYAHAVVHFTSAMWVRVHDEPT